jgi:hypothetical protein
MKAFLDTSVLVPVFYGDHEHHAASMKIFCKRRKDSVSFSGATRHPRYWDSSKLNRLFKFRPSVL